MKHEMTEMKGDRDNSTIYSKTSILQYTSLSITDKTTRLKINKELEDMNKTKSRADLTNYTTLHPRRIEYTFFSSEHGIFSRTDFR